MPRALPGIGAHHSARVQTDEWLTPPGLVAALGPFDLDPCSPVERPWPTAARHLTVYDDGLDEPWEGRVWLNPPYSQIEAWMARLAAHGQGTALVFARTETAWWFDSVWGHAGAALFLKGRVTFLRGDGSAPASNSGGPSVLLAYGELDASRLAASQLPGALVDLSWARVVSGSAGAHPGGGAAFDLQVTPVDLDATPRLPVVVPLDDVGGAGAQR